MSHETFNPIQFADDLLRDLCSKKKEELKENETTEMSENGWFLISNCESLYPSSYGIKHSSFGDSWTKRRGIFDPFWWSKSKC